MNPRSAVQLGMAESLGRYAVFEPIGSGGMATVHFARLVDDVGFGRTVAIKRLHPQFAKDAEFVASFLDEARLGSCVYHPNVVSTIDAVTAHGELFVVMDYVHGLTLGELLRLGVERGRPIPIPVALGIITGALRGLHAAHEATHPSGATLELVHRDVSPHNVLVGADGVPRVVDFGIAKAAMRVQATRDGRIKGKLAYMAPEQYRGAATRRSDVYAVGVVLWEAITGRRLFGTDDDATTIERALESPIASPSTGLPELDAITLRALDRDPDARFATALEMAEALEHGLPIAPASEIGAWVEDIAARELDARAARLAAIEAGTAPTTAARAAPRSRKTRMTNRRRAAALSAVLLAAAVVFAAFAARSPRQETTTTSSPPSPSTGDIPAPSASIVIAPAPRDETSTTGPSSTAPAASPSRRTGRGRGRTRASCDPPFSIDGFGHKVYKEDCLR